MKAKRGRESWVVCRRCFAYGRRWSRVSPLARRAALPRSRDNEPLQVNRARLQPERSGRSDMPVTFHIPAGLREFTNGKAKVEIEASPATLADALSALWTLYPGVHDRMANEQGQVRQHINIFIGDEDMRYTGGLMSPVPGGAQISIIPAVSGGQGWPRSRHSSRPWQSCPSCSAARSRGARGRRSQCNPPQGSQEYRVDKHRWRSCECRHEC